jgi:hypothetical protein
MENALLWMIMFLLVYIALCMRALLIGLNQLLNAILGELVNARQDSDNKDW